MLSPEVIRAADLISQWDGYTAPEDKPLRDAAHKLASHVLAHRSDYGPDGEPLAVDEAFLRESGGEWDEHAAAFWFLITGHERLFARANGQWWLQNQSTFGGTAGGKRHTRFRHQFRQLADVVGLSLTR